MAVGELARLERFRRVARAFGIGEVPSGLNSSQEISYLQGLINAEIYPTYQEWMLPSWAILTLRDMKKDTNVSILQNESYRNWSLIGGVGGKEFAVADSRGMTVGRSDCGCIDIWITRDDEILFSALEDKDGAQLHLVSTEDQLYHWKADSEAVEYTRLVYHVTRDDNEFLYNELNLKNLGLEKTTARFYVALRPMGLLGYEPIEAIRYDKSRNRILVNDRTALIFDQAPSSIMMSDASDAELLRKLRVDPDRIDDETENDLGLAQCILRYDVELAAAGSFRVFFVSPLADSSDGKLKPVIPQSIDRDTHVADWFDFVNGHVSVLLPDSTLDSTISQSIASIAIQAYSVLFPDTDHFARISWKDRIRILLALIQTGCDSLVLQMADDLVSRSDVPEGRIELSMFSPIVWGLLQIEEYGLGHKLSPSVHAFIEEALDGLIRSVPSGTENTEPDEDELLLEHYRMIAPGTFEALDDSLWNLAALQAAHRVMKKWSDPDKAKIISGSIRKYLEIIDSQISDVQGSRWPRPGDESMEHIDLEILNLLVTSSHMDLGLQQDFFDNLCEMVESRRIVKGLWKRNHPDELYSGHLSLRLAIYHAQRYRRDRIWPYLERILEFLSVDYLLPEYVNTKSYGGSAGFGSSVLAAADLVHLIRAMLLRERDGTMILFPGIPDEWYVSKNPLILKDLATRFGLTDLEIGASANQHQIEVSSANLPEEIEVHMPASVPMRMVKAFGASIVDRAIKASSPHLKIVPLTESVVLTFYK